MSHRCQQQHAQIPIDGENVGNLCPSSPLFWGLCLLNFHNHPTPTATAPAVPTAPIHIDRQEIGIQRFRDDFLKKKESLAGNENNE